MLIGLVAVVGNLDLRYIPNWTPPSAQTASLLVFALTKNSPSGHRRRSLSRLRNMSAFAFVGVVKKSVGQPTR
jgi:hypothetical protein